MCFYSKVTFSAWWIFASVVSSVVSPRLPLSSALWQCFSAEQCATFEQRSWRPARFTMGLAFGARRSCWGFVLVICGFQLLILCLNSLQRSPETQWRFLRLLCCGFTSTQPVHARIRHGLEFRRALADVFNALNLTSSSFMSDLKPWGLPARILHVLLWWLGCSVEPKTSCSRGLREKFLLTHQGSVSPSTNSSQQTADVRPHQIFCNSRSLLVCCIINIIMCVSTGESTVMEALGIHLIAYSVWAKMRQYVFCL